MVVSNYLRQLPFYGAGLYNAFTQSNKYRRPNRTPTKTRTTLRRKTPYKKPYGLKQAIRNMESAHHTPVGDGVGANAVTMTHNTIYTQNLLHFTGQNSTQGGRTGDTIYLETVKVNATFESATANINGITIRVMILFHDDFYANGFLGSGLGLSDLNMLTTGSGRATHLIVDPKKTTVLYDELYNLNPSIDAQVDTVPITFSCPLKRTFNFIPGSQEGKEKNLYLVVIPVVGSGTSGATTAGVMYCNTDVIFKVSK